MSKSNNAIKSQQFNTKTTLKCQHCAKHFKYESERKRHEQSHSPQFACKVCTKKFSFMSALKRHEKQHVRTGSVNCNKCNRKFRDESLLKRHFQYAHKGTFICNKCNTLFSSDLALRSHMKTHNTESERKYRCSFEGCKKSFNFAHHLRHHELTHTNTKQHFCVICGKGFIQYHHLKSHLKKHKGTQDFHIKCSILNCQKTFTTEHDLKEHLVTHKYSNNCEDTTLNTDSPNLGFVKGDSSDFELQKHHSKCSPTEVEIDEGCDLHNREINDQTKKADTLESVYPTPVSICNSYLGECIREYDANGNQNCLCAQMDCSVENTYNIVSKKILNTSIQSKINNDIKAQPVRPFNPVQACANCTCNNKNVKSDTNEDFIEYKSDGTIRIKDTFEMDLDVSMKTSDKIENREIPIRTVPFNSCKAVLGTCIVSGDGTIGEGCLCAKMAIDDQPIIEQEIDELTPCPKMY